MNMLKLSVMIPLLDNQETIKGTLDCLLCQQTDMEIICVDAGSSDDTLSILEQAEKEDSRVRFIKIRQKNCGLMLNRAMKEARGEYISILQPGDNVLEGMYQNLLATADKEKLDLIMSDFEAEEDSCLSKHASYYGQVFCPAEAYGTGESGDEITDCSKAEPEKETKMAMIPWLDLARCVNNGLYRRSFLQQHRIKFNELPGMDLPALGFWFQVFMYAKRVFLAGEKYCCLSKAVLSADSVFKEYDFIGNLLHRDEGLRGTFRSLYGRAYVQDVLACAGRVAPYSLMTYMEKAASAFRNLHDEGMLDYYALAPEEHKAVAEIMYDTGAYVNDKLLGETPRMSMEFMFPYHMFPERSKIVIYGAGNVGRTIYRQAIHDGYVKIAGIVDKNAEEMGETDIPAESVKKLSNMDYDYILLAIRSRGAADEAKKDLLKLGIPERKIKWDGTAYFRDEFYSNMYFPMLRAWNENYAEHGQFVNAFEIKMKGSINDHIFPYHLFWRGTKVALYGAGDIGKKYYRQAVHDGYVKIAGIVDRNPAAIYAPDVPVKAMGELKKMDFDYVLITVHGGSAINAIKEDLKKLGIPEGKIRWDGQTYYRDEFYRNVYFPLLQRVGGNFSSMNQLLEAMDKRLRYAIYDHIFPYHLFKEGETIAIYGAGDVGRKFYQQAKDYGWVKCVAIVDKNAEKINIPGIPVAPVGALKQFNFDKVLISMTNEKYANEAKETLIRMGIGEDRIKWAGKIYWREHFYRQYWFDCLRFIQEMRRSKI